MMQAVGIWHSKMFILLMQKKIISTLELTETEIAELTEMNLMDSLNY
jgi:hypothetical protein